MLAKSGDRGTVAVIAVLIALAFAASASAQSESVEVPAPAGTRPLGSVLTAETLADLPLGNNVYSLLETTQAELIADRFNSAGLNTGEGARIGGFLGSWTQTLFRIGDVDITDPSGSGSPLLFPELLFWRSVDVATGLMPADLNASGLATTLTPRMPMSHWTTIAQGFGSGGSLASSTPSGAVPPVARLNDWSHASVLVSGPLTRNPIPADVQKLTDVQLPNRVGLALGGTWTRASKFVRELMPSSQSDLASGFAHLVYAPSLLNEWRTLGWVQGTEVPLESRRVFPADNATKDQSVHLQSTWEHREPAGLNWRVLGALTERSREVDGTQVSSLTTDRLLDGPVPAVASATGQTTTRRWTLAARGKTRDTVDFPHVFEFGANLDHALVASSDQFVGSIGELVDNVPARLWIFTHPDATSRRHSKTVSAFAGDRITLSPALSLSASIRFESITGGADGAASGVHWYTWLPRAVFSWKVAGQTSLVAGYRRSANQLNLDLLSYGDPNAPTASVTRWSGTLPAGPVIDLVGPGTGGNPAFSRIDPDLKRPYTDEFVVGIQSRRRGWLNLGLFGIARREANLLGVDDIGVPIDSYSTVAIADPGLDFFSDADDQTLTVYNRLPSTYGRNQYLLTNTGQPAATAYALKLTADGSTDRLFVLFGATASMANGSAGNRGYGPLENDQDVLGELFTDPNAATHSQGRLFSDRAFTIKWTTVYRFPGDVRVGAIARYQDGQPAARLVIAPGLNQGPEPVRAFPNGKNRFTFTGTLDLRVQKGFTIGRSRLDAIADFYNLATRSNEVDEYVVTGPDFRTPTAIEPPRAIHLGLRLAF